jgi:hypothetical protein
LIKLEMFLNIRRLKNQISCKQASNVPIVGLAPGVVFVRYILTQKNVGNGYFPLKSFRNDSCQFFVHFFLWKITFRGIFLEISKENNFFKTFPRTIRLLKDSKKSVSGLIACSFVPFQVLDVHHSGRADLCDGLWRRKRWRAMIFFLPPFFFHLLP